MFDIVMISWYIIKTKNTLINIKIWDIITMKENKNEKNVLIVERTTYEDSKNNSTGNSIIQGRFRY